MKFLYLYLENYAFPPRNGLKYIGPVGPSEFVGLIKNAEYVITNSFSSTIILFLLVYLEQFPSSHTTEARR